MSWNAAVRPHADDRPDARAALRALVDALPRCCADLCTEPATHGYPHQDEDDFCDAHRPGDRYAELPYAGALRRARAVLAAPVALPGGDDYDRRG